MLDNFAIKTFFVDPRRLFPKHENIMAPREHHRLETIPGDLM